MDGLENTSPFLPLPDSLAITSVAATAAHLVVHVTCTSSTACCPVC
jgi:hypothetical protein